MAKVSEVDVKIFHPSDLNRFNNPRLARLVTDQTKSEVYKELIRLPEQGS